jgi:hypothetical protein
MSLMSCMIDIEVNAFVDPSGVEIERQGAIYKFINQKQEVFCGDDSRHYWWYQFIWHEAC